MAITLQLDRGTAGTIDLNDGTNYALLDGWQPRVAKRQRSQLAGRWPYENVIEQIPIRVFSKQSDPATAKAEVLQKLGDLAAALDQAYTWYNGAQVDPVILKYQPEGSALANPLQSVVLGAPDSARDMLSLPVTFNRDMQAWEINPLVLEIERRGLWLGDAETPAASASVGNPGVMTVTFNDIATLPSPVKIEMIAQATPTADYHGYIFVASEANKLIITEAESMLLDVDLSIQTDARASGGKYVSFLPSTVTITRMAMSPLNIDVNARRFAAFAMVRNYSSTLTYILKFVFATKKQNQAITRRIVIPPDFTPQMVFLGIGALPDVLNSITLHMETTSTTTSGNELGVDYIVTLALDENSFPIKMNERTLDDGSVQGVDFDDVVIDSAAIDSPSPIVYETPSNRNYIDHSGNAFLLHVGNQIHAMICMSKVSSISPSWTIIDNADANIPYTLTATRYKGYLTPR